MNSGHYIILALVIVLAVYIGISLNELERLALQNANKHAATSDVTNLAFVICGIIGSVVAFIMMIKKKIVLALAALILVSIAFYGYYVLDKIECEHCAKA